MNISTKFCWLLSDSVDKKATDQLTDQQSDSFIPLNPLPDDKILDYSKLKQSADNILKCI